MSKATEKKETITNVSQPTADIQVGKSTGGSVTMGNVKVNKGFKPEVNVNKSEYSKLDATGFYKLLENRISVEHAQRIVVELISSGRIKITDPNTVANWSYKRIMVQGCNYNGPGKKVSAVTLTADEFAKITPAELGAMFEGNISVERAKAIVLELVKGGVVTPTMEELRDWSNNRVMPEGLTAMWNHGAGGGANKSAVSVAGVVSA